MFTFSTWPADSQITLAKVTWDQDYRNIVAFENSAQFIEHVKTRTAIVYKTDASIYCKPMQGIKLELPFDQVMKANYCLVQNGAEYYAYFITSAEFVSPSVTRISVQLDVWNTYNHRVSLGSCFVERGHLSMTTDMTKMSGYRYSWYPLTIAENLEIGSEHVVTSYKRIEIPAAYVIQSTVDITKPGTVNDPNVKSSTGQRIQSTYQGNDVFYTEQRLDLLLAVLSDVPWVTQGIVSITAIPRLQNVKGEEIAIGGTRLTKLESWQSYEVFETDLKPDETATRKKSEVSPYKFYEVTAHTGSTVLIQPEKLANELKLVVQVQPLQPGARVVITFPNYNLNNMYTPDDPYLGDRSTCLVIDNLPQLSVTANSGILYRASSAHSLAQSIKAAEWSYNKANRSASVSADIATNSIEASKASTAVSMDTALQQQHINAVTAGANGVLGAVGSAAGGNAVGAVTGALSTGVNIASGYASVGLQNSAMQAQNNISTSSAAYARDSNLALANFANKGDFEQTLAGINARVKDAQVSPPTTAGHMGGDLFNLIHRANKFTIDVLIREPDEFSKYRIFQYWNRYGYAVNDYCVLKDHQNRLTIMKYYTYWKCHDLYVSGNIPEVFRDTIRAIFERGVTVWRPEWISTVGTFKPIEQEVVNDIEWR